MEAFCTTSSLSTAEVDRLVSRLQQPINPLAEPGYSTGLERGKAWVLGRASWGEIRRLAQDWQQEFYEPNSCIGLTLGDGELRMRGPFDPPRAISVPPDLGGDQDQLLSFWTGVLECAASAYEQLRERMEPECVVQRAEQVGLSLNVADGMPSLVGDLESAHRRDGQLLADFDAARFEIAAWEDR